MRLRSTDIGEGQTEYFVVGEWRSDHLGQYVEAIVSAQKGHRAASYHNQQTPAVMTAREQSMTPAANQQHQHQRTSASSSTKGSQRMTPLSKDGTDAIRRNYVMEMIQRRKITRRDLAAQASVQDFRAMNYWLRGKELQDAVVTESGKKLFEWASSWDKRVGLPLDEAQQQEITPIDLSFDEVVSMKRVQMDDANAKKAKKSVKHELLQNAQLNNSQKSRLLSPVPMHRATTPMATPTHHHFLNFNYTPSASHDVLYLPTPGGQNQVCLSPFTPTPADPNNRRHLVYDDPYSSFSNAGTPVVSPQRGGGGAYSLEEALRNEQLPDRTPGFGDGKTGMSYDFGSVHGGTPRSPLPPSSVHSEETTRGSGLTASSMPHRKLSFDEPLMHQQQQQSSSSSYSAGKTRK